MRLHPAEYFDSMSSIGLKVTDACCRVEKLMNSETNIHQRVKASAGKDQTTRAGTHAKIVVEFMFYCKIG